MKLRIGHIKAQRHGSIGLSQLRDPHFLLRFVVHAAAGGAAGDIKGAFRIDGCLTGGVGIAAQCLAEAVHKSCPGVHVVVGAEDQVNVVVVGDPGQIFLAVGMGALRSRISGKVLGQDAPPGVGVFSHHLRHILLLIK